MNTKLSTILLATLGFSSQVPTNACTGITLKSKDGATIAARTDRKSTRLNSSHLLLQV